MTGHGMSAGTNEAARLIQACTRSALQFAAARRIDPGPPSSRLAGANEHGSNGTANSRSRATVRGCGRHSTRWSIPCSAKAAIMSRQNVSAPPTAAPAIACKTRMSRRCRNARKGALFQRALPHREHLGPGFLGRQRVVDRPLGEREAVLGAGEGLHLVLDVVLFEEALQFTRDVRRHAAVGLGERVIEFALDAVEEFVRRIL